MSQDAADLVTVFESCDFSAFVRAKSILDGAGIGCVTSAPPLGPEEAVDAPVDTTRVDPTHPAMTGPYQIRVRQEHVAAAWPLLAYMPPHSPAPAAVACPAPLSQPSKPFPGIGWALLLLLMLFALQMVFGVIYGVVIILIYGPGATAGGGAPVDPSITAAATGVINLAVFALVLTVAVSLARRPVRDVLPFPAFPVAVVLPLAVAVVGIGIVCSDLDNLLQYFFPMPDFIQKLIEELIGGGIATFIVLVVVAPLTEELFFRGLLMKGFVPRYGAIGAILLTSVLFALIHVNPYQFIPAFLMGLFLGWLFVRTGSLWPCIIAHALFNLQTIVIPIVRDRFGLRIPGYTEVPESGAAFQPLWFDALGLMLLAVGVLGVAVFSRSRKDGLPSGGTEGAQQA